jgi:hypothetical protein
MHFHLPKPLHGWRAFVGEVGIIVIGVLIALAAEQVVQSIHERSEVHQLRTALRSELADDRARWERIRSGDFCTGQRLNALGKWLGRAPPGATLDGHPYRVFLWTMHSSAWDIAKTSPAMANIPLDERLTDAALYGATDNWREFINEESENSRALGALLATADQLENRRQIRYRLLQARYFLEQRRLTYPYFDKLGIKPDYSQQTVSSDPAELCKPMGGQGDA